MATMTASFADSSQVEVGMFGFEFIIGISALIGTKRSLDRTYTQIPGSGYSSSIENARTEFLLAGSFHSLALRSNAGDSAEKAQSAASSREDGFVHATVNVTAANTGRFELTTVRRFFASY
jgi:hypothetical protein